MQIVIKRKWVSGVLMVNALGVLILTFLLMPAARAADEEVTETPQGDSTLLQLIKNDPELAAALHSGELKLEDLGLNSEGTLTTPLEVVEASQELTRGAPLVESILPVPGVDVGGGLLSGGQIGGDYLPPAAREELEKLFQQGTGDPSSTTDQALREEAEKILEKYGVDPNEIGPGHEQEGDWTERGGVESQITSPREAFEQWKDSEEARNVPEDVIKEYEERAIEYQREYEQHQQEFEQRSGQEIEYGGQEQTYETPTHDFETSAPEASVSEHETSTHEYEAPTPMSEVPMTDYQPSGGYQY